MSKKICGFLHAFNDRALIGPNKYERFAPGSIINKTVALRLAHNPASGANFAQATISQNDFGYKFEALVPNRQDAHGLARMISGGCDGISMCFRPLRSKTNGVVTVIQQARLTEISIVPEGAYPSARCWVAGDLSGAPPDIRALAAEWNKEQPPDTWGEWKRSLVEPEGRVASALASPSHGNSLERQINHDPVRAAVQNFMGSYLARGFR